MSRKTLPCLKPAPARLESGNEFPNSRRLETQRIGSGSYGWLVDEMERCGRHPRLCNPHEAKRRMGLTNKTNKLDAKGLAIGPRNGTLPEFGFRRVSCVTSANSSACASFRCDCARE